MARLRALEPFADDPSFRQRFAEVKRLNKVRLAEGLQKSGTWSWIPDSIFDVQVKMTPRIQAQL